MQIQRVLDRQGDWVWKRFSRLFGPAEIAPSRRVIRDIHDAQHTARSWTFASPFRPFWLAISLTASRPFYIVLPRRKMVSWVSA